MYNNISSEHILENIQKLAGYYQEIMSYLLQNEVANTSLKFMDNDYMQEITGKVMNQFFSHPEKFVDLNLEYVGNVQKLVADSVTKFMGYNTDDSSGTQSEDKRFKDENWQQSIYFDFIKQYYLLTGNWMQNIVRQYDVDKDSKNYLEFISKQFIDALSPSNFIFSNPEVMKETLETGMDNIVNGMKNFLNDIKNSGGMPNISTTDKAFFKVGKNIAATPGKVVYQNDLIQLICYEPLGKTYSVPLLFIPPCINKYYILDLSEKNSMIRWLVKNNFQVFLISWVNPNAKLADKNFEDYLQEGILESCNYIKKLGYKKINTAGYCIGGTMLASALSYLKKTKQDYVNSATFITTLVDFNKPGQIGALINKSTINMIEKEVTSKGYLDGRYLSGSFSLIRANDLIWSFFVNNYLLGKVPTAFDILYWNSDPTNLPAKMYLYYLKNMYIDNLLKKPDALTMLGVKIDLSQIDVPSFSLAAKGDHIALWQGVYDGYKLLSGNKTFCLTDAGHVAGVVNPADNKKYSHHIGTSTNESSKEWRKSATDISGSWWSSWHKWLKAKSGKLEKSLNYEKLDSIEPAPGTYVKK